MGRLLSNIYKFSTRNLSKNAFLEHAALNDADFLTSREIPNYCPPIRGFTSSLKHKDIYCCVGSFLGSNYTVLHRELDDKVFIIVHIGLSNLSNMRHCYILHNSTSNAIFERMMSLHPHHNYLPISPKLGFPPSFSKDFSVLTKPADFLHWQNIINRDLIKIIETPKVHYIHEINGKDLYVYSYYKDAPKGKTVDAQVGYTCLFANGIISN